jgi:hypothetical protein
MAVNSHRSYSGPKCYRPLLNSAYELVVEGESYRKRQKAKSGRRKGGELAKYKTFLQSRCGIDGYICSFLQSTKYYNQFFALPGGGLPGSAGQHQGSAAPTGPAGMIPEASCLLQAGGPPSPRTPGYKATTGTKTSSLTRLEQEQIITIGRSRILWGGPMLLVIRWSHPGGY